MTETCAMSSVRGMKTLISYRLPVLGVAALLLVTGCASVELDPCSRAGIEQRVNASLKSFSRENRGDINDIKKAAQYLDGETVAGAMKLYFAVNAMERLVESFSDDVVPEVQQITQQCGTSENVRELFFDFLRDEGVNKEVLSWAENLSSILEITKS